MINRKLKVGVVGLGMGRTHIAGYKSHPGAEVVALCDRDEKRLDIVSKEFGILRKFTEAEEMFQKADLDAVSIATPNKFHAPLTIAALKAGLHVLCEKPMAMNSEEAQKMNDMAKKTGKNLMVNFSFRFTDVSFALKQQVDSGVIGDIYFGRTVWHRRRGIPLKESFCEKDLSGGGPLIDLGVHRLDLALWLMGYPEPVSISGSTYDFIGRETAVKLKRKFDVEDLACGLIKFKNGATLILEASWALNIKEPEHMVTMLCGTKGGLVHQNIGGGYEFRGEIYTEEGGHLFTKIVDRSITPTPSAYHEFVNSILEKRKPLATPEEGIKVMKILDGIYESAQTGREMRY